jgi:GDPmannose 4,6-dehydratase
MRKKAIIFGINGQDGYYLTDFLLKKKYFIIGVARSKKINKYLKKFEKNILIKIKNKLDYNFLVKTIKKNKPNEIYFFIGQSSSSISFDQPIETIHSNFNLINYIIEICRLYSPNTKIFNASSSEIFGDSLIKVSENSKKDPQNPYALSKYLSLLCTKFYREKFKMFVCSGILFNHESEIRSKKNVIKKISEYLNK